MPMREPTPEEREKWELAQIKQGHTPFFARPIRSVMRKLMNERGYASVESSGELVDAWPEVAGARLAGSTRVGKIAKGVLLVEVNSSMALQEAHFDKQRLLRSLREKLPHVSITDLRFRMASF